MYRNLLPKQATSYLGNLFKSHNTQTAVFFPAIRSCYRCFSLKRELKEVEIAKNDRGYEIERSDVSSKKPRKNVPFVKELFAGRYNKVLLSF